ncbi:AarF/UbiB family protein [Roseomonas sp. OT10]|uniref:ABC1 kinase family protein n=1 Tax=Roseomonas cutis TaxID=2897332 RepID=UPI001E53FB6B|nr:AarF/UbiB family protein [Roseomonas sp. OT10]UFN47107.1 AarF/UbiB family protein [Roseomonas sp. OT10]
MALVAARDRKRIAEIGGVVARFGLGALLSRLGLGGWAPGEEGEAAGPGLPHRFRLALEALGPTFVKLGQILGTRADLLPRDWIAELEQLQSGAPRLPFEALRAQVEEDLGAAPETVFAHFDTEPLAAASIAQVHRARLADGTEVVLKIRRPGIRPRMEADLRLLAALAATAEQAGERVARHNPRALLRQLTEAVLEELDFTQEGRNADRLAANFRGRDGVVVPRIHWSLSSERLLVQDYLAGTPPTSAERLRAAGIDPRRIAALGAEVVLDMVLVDGLFHADPHPGNLLCLPGDRIGLLDLGMVGHVSPRRREEMVGFVTALATGDPARLAEVLAIWSDGRATASRLTPAAERLIARHGSGRLVLTQVMADMMALVREEGLAMPPDLLLIFKALATIDGVLNRIDPGFDLAAAAGQAGRRVLQARTDPDALRRRLSALLLDLGSAGDDLPRLLRAATRRLNERADGPDPRAAALERLAAALRWGAALLAGSVLAGAVLVALALRWG